MKRLYKWCVAVGLCVSASCGTDSPTGPIVEVNQLRLEFAGDETGTLEISGMPVFPNDYTRDFVALSRGRVNGILAPHQVLGIRAASTHDPTGYDSFLMFLNPVVDRKGRFDPGDCPEPSGFGGCADISVSFGGPAEGGVPKMSLSAIPDSVSITIHRITPDTLQASFNGRFMVLMRPGEPDGRVTISNGSIFAVRLPVD
jgi:hypothetical protein